MARRTFSDIGLLGLYTETSLHCGTESGAGYVDLPIQRERHTGYPVIPGSTIKGILRDEVSGSGGLSPDQVRALFGTLDASGPGTVSFGDAIVAAFPVRSSGAPFHWTTCPFVVERVLRALGSSAPRVDSPPEGKAWAAAAGPLLLEELRVETEAHADFATI
ncbi:MAG TPA: type III-B CRISPR module RAMP protein Cmr4, partial [Vicinamibacteria bacterium]